MSTLGEIELLSEILNASENPDDGSGKHCPSPAVLWALVEDTPPREAGLISSLRAHVVQCAHCAELARRFQGFVTLPETPGARETARKAEAAWAAAAPRLDRRIEQMLGNLSEPHRAGKQTSSFWKFSWLPSLQLHRLNVAWAAAAFALVAIATLASMTYFGRQESETGIAKTEAPQAPPPTAEAPDRSGANQAQPTESEKGEPSGAVPPAGSAQVPGAPSSASRSDRGMPAFSTVSSPESGPTAASMLLSSGARARVTILFAHRESGGIYSVQGELTPLSSPAEQGERTATFLALVTGLTGQERLTIGSFSLNGRQFELRGEGSAAVSVSWPEHMTGLAAGQTFDVRLVSGAFLRGVASPK